MSLLFLSNFFCKIIGIDCLQYFHYQHVATIFDKCSIELFHKIQSNSSALCLVTEIISVSGTAISIILSSNIIGNRDILVPSYRVVLEDGH